MRFRGSQKPTATVREAAREAAQNAPQVAREVAQAAPQLAREVAQNAPQLAREVAQNAPQLAREVAQSAPQRARELRAAAAQLDIRWARSAPARLVRENFMRWVMNPLMDHYAARRAAGFEKLAALQEPVIMVANHSSHMDTPVILSALPRRLRKRTAVAAAADYFYKNKFVASLVSLLFNTVPLDRNGGGLSKNGAHLDKLLDEGWNLLLYPEGTRSRGDGLGHVRRGAAVLAAKHDLPIVPIRVTGTGAAMPPGQVWPRRLGNRFLRRRHRIEVTFGEPIPPLGDTAAMIERVQRYFENGESGPRSRNPYRRRPKPASRS